MAKKYTVSDGKLTLELQEIEDGWLLVRSPTDPAMITQARTIKEAFVMARDAFAALAESRKDPARWDRPIPRRARRRPLVSAERNPGIGTPSCLQMARAVRLGGALARYAGRGLG